MTSIFISRTFDGVTSFHRIKNFYKIRVKASIKDKVLGRIWARGYKTFFMLNSVEHELLNADKLKNIKKVGFFYAQIRLECYFSRS